MLNILDQRKKNLNNSTSLVAKQSSVVVLRKNKFKSRIEKQISKEKEKIKNLDFAVNNIISDYNLSHGINVNNNNNKLVQRDNLNIFPNLNATSFPFDNINFGFDIASNDITLESTSKREGILRRRRPQLYKSSHGFRLSFCNLTDKEKKDQRASIYRKQTKNMRERDFFSRRQMQRDNESLFDCLQKYYYENDENFKRTRNKNTFKSIDSMDSLFGYTNNQPFSRLNNSSIGLSKNYIYNYFNVKYRRRRNEYSRRRNRIYGGNRFKIDDDSDEDFDLDSDIDDNETIHNKNKIINFNFNNQNMISFNSFGSVASSNSKYNYEISKEIYSQDRRRQEMLMKRRQQYKSRSSISIQRRNSSEDDQMNNPNLIHIICDECCKKIKNHELYYSNINNSNNNSNNDNWIYKLKKNNDISNNSSNKPLICEYCRCIKDKALCSISLTTDFSQKVIYSRRNKKRNSIYLTSNHNITSKAYNPSLSAVPSSKAQRIKQYLKRTRIARKVQVWSRRKLFLMGLSNERQNLGNLLNITDSYNDDLSFDNDQSLKITEPSLLNSILVPGIENPFQIVTLQSDIELENNSDLLFLFNQANELVKTEFSAKDMCVHLDSSLDEGLTVDIIVKEKVRTNSKLYCECNKHDDSESAKNFLKSNSFQFNNNNYDNPSNINTDGIHNNNNNNFNIMNTKNNDSLDRSFSRDESYMSYQNQNQSEDMTEVDSKDVSGNDIWLHTSSSKSNSSTDLDSSSTLINENEQQFSHLRPHRRILFLPENDNKFEEGEEDERCVYCHKLKYNRKNYLKYENEGNDLSSSSSTSRRSHNFSPRNVEVVAVMEYVFMKRYMWLEVIAVKQEYKGLGIGKLLMHRMSSIANAKDKDILLYSLNDVISFYKQFDFEFSPKFPHKSYHDGWFMTKRCRTPKNIFIP